MATRTDSTAIDATSQGVLAALGGTVNDTDEVYIGHNNNYTFVGGNDINKDLAVFQVLPTHRASILGLQFNASTGVVSWMGGGELYTAASNASKGVQQTVIVDLSGGVGRLEYSDVTITDLVARAGTVSLASNADVTDVAVSGSAQVELTAGGGAVTRLETTENARVQLERDVTTMEVAGNSSVKIDSTTCSPTTIKPKGGTVEFNRSGNVGTIGVSGEDSSGVLDFSRVAQPITVGQIYESTALRIRLPRASPDIVTFTASDVSKGTSSRELV